MKIEVKKIGGIWHGVVEGHPEIDERGLTEEIARRKAGEALERVLKYEPSKQEQFADDQTHPRRRNRNPSR